nr:MAG TPA: hypothetical protein [Caudoviricetes sp.]
MYCPNIPRLYVCYLNQGLSCIHLISCPSSSKKVTTAARSPGCGVRLFSKAIFKYSSVT